MKVWILFIYLANVSMPTPSMFLYTTQAECERDSENYRRAVCRAVEVPKR